MWKQNLDIRERALSHKHALADRRWTDRRWTEHTKSLPPMAVGTHVHIQNQTGPRPNKWDKTGVVVEVLDFHQYAIRVDGSGRQTIRNRRFLRSFVPARQQPPRHTAQEDVQTLSPTTPVPSGSLTSTHTMSHPLPPPPPAPPVDVAAPPTMLSDSDTETHSLTAPSSSPDAETPPPHPPTDKEVQTQQAQA